MDKTHHIWLLALLLCFGIEARADNVVSLSTASGAPGTEVTISVSMANTDAITTLQLSIPLDEELSLVENSANAGSRLSDHSVTVGTKNGVLNIVLPKKEIVETAPISKQIEIQ